MGIYDLKMELRYSDDVTMAEGQFPTSNQYNGHQTINISGPN